MFVNCYQRFAKEKAMEEISNEVLLLAQQLDLEIDTEDTDQPVQNLAEELDIEDLMEVEASACREEHFIPLVIYTAVMIDGSG